MKTVILVMASGVFLTRTGFGQDAAADLKKMAGAWKTRVHEAGGKPTPKDLIDKTAGKLVVTGNKYKVYFGDKFIDEGTITLDATKKPRHIDVKTSKDLVMKGIYKFDKEEMTVCFAQPGNDRPTEFKTKEGTQQVLLGYQRIKKD